MVRERKKVVWFEGMTLDPHHFQQWDRYQQWTMNGRLRALSPNGWGLLERDVDRDRLANGEFVLRRLSGIMPDGLLFQMPDNDDLPPPRPVQEAFSATRDRLGVFLTIPAESESNYQLQGSTQRQEKRYAARTATMLDENTGGDDRPVELADARFQLRLEGEPLEGSVHLQVATLVRSTGGAIALDDDFVPTCLSLSASDHLVAVTRRLVELLVAKSLSLGDRHRGAAMQRELSPADFMALGLLATVNTYIPVLNHFLTQGNGHPEQLYRTLLALGGALTAQLPGANQHPRTFPAYDHTDLSACFGEMDALLRGMLGEATPRANYVRLALQEQRENLFIAPAEEAVLDDAQFFLVARGDGIAEDRLVNDLPRMLRIASPATIENVLRSYTRALTVEHTHRLPVGLPVDQQANYFQIQKRGPFWDAIRSERALALFIPAEFNHIKIEVVAVQ